MTQTMTNQEQPKSEIEKVRQSLTLPQPDTFEEMLLIFKKWLILDDPETLKIIIASMIANRLQGDPLWLFVIAPPGGAKTEILRSLQGSFALAVSTLSEHSLISGMRTGPNSPDPSLIPKLDEKILIIKDFTSILSMRRESREEILGTLRDAYDGECSKAFGSRVGTISYKSKFGIVAGVTPLIDKYLSIEQQLGERFLKVRMRSIHPDSAVFRALDNIGKENQMRAELRSAAQSVLLKTLAITKDLKFQENIPDQLVALANLLAILRSNVSRNYFDNSIDYVPEAEIGTRLVKQLTKIALGIALVDRRTFLTDEDYQIAKRVALDTLSSKKKVVLDALIQMKYQRGDQFFITQEIGDICNFPSETCKKILEDLRILNAVQRSGTYKFSWRLSEKIWQYLEKAQL